MRNVETAIAALGDLDFATTAKVCSIKRMLDELPEEHRTPMDDAIHQAKSLTGIRAVLLGLGYDIATTTISRHRAGICKCPKR